MKSKQVVIIGGGIGGLAAAIRMTAIGLPVTVCEQGESFGGKMNTWSSNGFRFDTGPSLITMPWIFNELFEIAGSHLEEHLEMVSMHPLSDYSFADGTRFSYSANLPEWLATVRNLEPKDTDGFLRFMKLGARLFELSKDNFLRRPPFSAPRQSDLSGLRHFPLRNAWGNYSNVVGAHFKSPQLQQMYNRYPTYVGSSPYKSPATLSIIPYIEYAFNGWYPKGGLYKIIESFLTLAKRLHVTLLSNTKVERIEHSNHRVTSVKLSDGAILKADIVIANCEARDAGVMLGEPNAVRLEPENRSMSGIVFLIGCRKTIPELNHHSIYFSADYKAEFKQIFEEQRFPDDPTVYVNCPSRSDRTIVPGAGESLFIMANAPSGDQLEWDESMIAKARKNIFDRLRLNGFPDIENEIVVEEVWTPQKIASRYAMPGGAIYGTHSHGWKKAFLRPSNKDRKYEGLYYVGGSTHPGGGTPTVLLSAQITADLIKKYELA